MSKRIVSCADGTWLDPLNNTNVYRLYKALEVSAEQVTFYDDGVGADTTGIAHILDGAFGAGLLQKIQDGYTTIAHTYEPNDQLFLFGFSRGAYTVRCLAGMIAACGLPTGTFTNDCITQAFAAYRNPSQRAAILAGLAAYNLQPAAIQMVGVWDTVGALGVPAIFGGVDQKKYGFLDTALHPCIKNAFHCIALDEKRAQFPATLWDEPPSSGQTLEQVWFSGCHCDVGGGTAPGGPAINGTMLCDIPMGWMISKAQQCGLTFVSGATDQYATLPAETALDAIRETWKLEDGPPHLRPVAANARIANSVAVRLKYALTYVPGSLTVVNGALADTYVMDNVVSDSAF